MLRHSHQHGGYRSEPLPLTRAALTSSTRIYTSSVRTHFFGSFEDQDPFQRPAENFTSYPFSLKFCHLFFVVEEEPDCLFYFCYSYSPHRSLCRQSLEKAQQYAQSNQENPQDKKTERGNASLSRYFLVFISLAPERLVQVCLDFSPIH